MGRPLLVASTFKLLRWNSRPGGSVLGTATRSALAPARAVTATTSAPLAPAGVSARLARLSENREGRERLR
jgi:hypothetical protein